MGDRHRLPAGSALAQKAVGVLGQDGDPAHADGSALQGTGPKKKLVAGIERRHLRAHFIVKISGDQAPATYEVPGLSVGQPLFAYAAGRQIHPQNAPGPTMPNHSSSLFKGRQG